MAQRAIYGLVDSPARAERVVEELAGVGIDPQDVSVLFHDRAQTRDFAHDQHTTVPERAAAGAGAGAIGIVGGTIGLLAGIVSIAIPGLGALVAVGPVLGALAGAAVGAAVGAGLSSVAGALITLGVPVREAKHYAGKLKRGGVLISVQAEDGARAAQVEALFRANAVEGVSRSAEVSALTPRAAAKRPMAGSEAVLPSPPRMSPPPPRRSQPGPSAPHT